MKKIFRFYNLCFSIIVQSAPNLSMSFFSSKLKQPKSLKKPAVKKTINKKSQIQQLIDKQSVNVAIVNDKAYWVYDNTFYSANINVDGQIDTDNALPVDVFSASKKEAVNLLKILDSLKEK